MSGLCDGRHVKQLSGVILNAAEHHHGDGLALLLDGFQDVGGTQGCFSLEEPEALNFLPNPLEVHVGSLENTVPLWVTASACCAEGQTPAGGSETPRRTGSKETNSV